MSGALDYQTFDDAIIIRYDGLDADRHEIDMALLADSLRGFSRIIGVAGNFAAHERLILHRDAFSVRVVVRSAEPRCFTLSAVLLWINGSPLLTTVAGGLTVSLVAYIFSVAAGKRDEMRHLRDALDSAIRELGHRDQTTVDRLLTTIDRMAESLLPTVRQAVAPVGQTVRTVTIADKNHKPLGSFDSADKDAILSEPAVYVGPEATYSVLFTEMDTETGACKISVSPNDEDLESNRISAKITDPIFLIANNPYVLALAAKIPMLVIAKPLMKNGEIDRLFISNTEI